MSLDDWRTIAPATNPALDNVRRVDALHPLDFFRGRDFAGRYILTLSAQSGAADLPDRPRLNGVRVQVELQGAEAARLVLTLEDQAQFDIFRALCVFLLEATAGLPRGANAEGMRLVLERLRDWHEMLKRGLDNLLTLPEIIGLAGELLFLRDEILTRAAAATATPAWRGPRDEQDFAFGEWLIEVKTQMSTADQRLRISSAAQLDTSSGRILLCHQSVAPADTSLPGAFSLNAIAADVHARVSSSSVAVAGLEAVLSAWKYLRRPEYDEPMMLLTQRRVFEVLDGFPRIVPAMIAPGIDRVSYEIPLDQCAPFSVESAAAFDRVFS